MLSLRFSSEYREDLSAETQLLTGNHRFIKKTKCRESRHGV